MLLTRLTQRRILDAQREPVHSVQTGGAQSLAAVRHTNIIAHHEDRVCREVGRISEFVAVAFLAVKFPGSAVRISESVSHFLGIETPGRSGVRSSFAPARRVLEVRTKTSVPTLCRCADLRDRSSMSTSTHTGHLVGHAIVTMRCARRMGESSGRARHHGQRLLGSWPPMWCGPYCGRYADY